jgi:copper transport protein
VTARRGLAGAIVALSALALGAATAPVRRAAAFHTELTGAYPAADSAHALEIREIRLRFSTAVQPALSTIALQGPGGEVETGSLEAVAGTGDAEIHVFLPAPLPPGAYTVEWRTAGPDNHVIEGSYGFSVTAPVEVVVPAPVEQAAQPQRTPSVPSTPGTGTGPTPRTVAEGWLYLLSLVGMVGTVAFRLGVVGPFGRSEDRAEVAARIGGRTRVLAILAVLLGLCMLPVRLLAQARRVAGADGSALEAAGRVLGSPWGSAWTLGASGTLLFLVGLLSGRGKPAARTPWLVSGLGALLVAMGPALSGHAAAAGPALVALDTVHVLAGGVWLGGLACLVLVGISGAARAGEASTLAPLTARFSAMALPAAIVLVVSGVTNAVDRIALGDLFGSAYGRTLLLKVAVVVGALSLGFYNWRVVRPALEQEGRPGLLRIPASLELVAGLVVLAVTAALVVTALP